MNNIITTIIKCIYIKYDFLWDCARWKKLFTFSDKGIYCLADRKHC